MKGFHQAEAEQKGGLKELQKHVSAKNKAVDPKVVAGFNQAKVRSCLWMLRRFKWMLCGLTASVG